VKFFAHDKVRAPVSARQGAFEGLSRELTPNRVLGRRDRVHRPCPVGFEGNRPKKSENYQDYRVLIQTLSSFRSSPRAVGVRGSWRRSEARYGKRRGIRNDDVFLCERHHDFGARGKQPALRHN
jgi:hypothetical protein